MIGALAPRGTRLCDLPADFRGLSWREFEESVWADRRAERIAAAELAPAQTRPIATARDRYGWRSLPSGSSYIGAPAHRGRS